MLFLVETLGNSEDKHNSYRIGMVLFKFGGLKKFCQLKSKPDKPCLQYYMINRLQYKIYISP